MFCKRVYVEKSSPSIIVIILIEIEIIRAVRLSLASLGALKFSWKGIIK
jgi:hypothetical protein